MDKETRFIDTAHNTCMIRKCKGHIKLACEMGALQLSKHDAKILALRLLDYANEPSSPQWEELQKKHFSEEEIRADKAAAVATALEVAELTLKGLRDALGKTQEDLSAATKLAQSDISKIESREDHLVSTLKRYVEGLGGKLEIQAVFGSTRISLTEV